RIGRRKPHERWPVVIRERTEPPMNLPEELANRQDAMFADESGDLNGQRHERDEIDDTKEPKKKPAGSGECGARRELKNGAILDQEAPGENEETENSGSVPSSVRDRSG